MKVMMEITIIWAVALTLILPSLAFAGGYSGGHIPSKIKVTHTGIVQIWWGGTDDHWANPQTACTSSEYIVLVPEFNGTITKSYSEVYAFLVGSYLQGKSIEAYLSGCFEMGTETYPRVSSITG